MKSYSSTHSMSYKLTCLYKIYIPKQRESILVGRFSFRYDRTENVIRKLYINAMLELNNIFDKCPKNVTVIAFADLREGSFRISIHRDDFNKYIKGNF